MWPLEVNILQDIAIATLLVTIVFYLLFAIKKAIQIGSINRADKYLRYREDGVDEDVAGRGGIDKDELKATLMAGSFSLASAIYVYIEWAAYDGLLALWSPITWALGVVVLVLVSRKIFAASKEAWTMHAYLEKKYDSAVLSKTTSAVTSSVFMLQVAEEVVVGIAVLKHFVGVEFSVEALSFMIGSVFIAYCLIGGLPSALQTDVVQYKLVAFSLIAALLIAFNDGGATAVENIINAAPTFIPGGVAWVVVISLLALNLPLLITDMSVWQRVGASKSPDEANSGTRKFAVILLMWMSLLVLFGTGFAVSFSELPDTRPAVGMISYFSDSIVYPILVAGLIGALISTADTFLISSVQTIIADWRYKKQLFAVDYDSTKLDEVTHKRMIRDSRIGVLILGIASVVVGVLAWNHLSLLIEFLFVVFGMQTALAPTVVNSLYGAPDKNQSGWSIASVLSGVFVALVGLILAMLGIEVAGLSVAIWTPITSLFTSVVVMVVGIKLTKQAVA